MECSDELRELTLRIYETTTTGDLSVVERHVSRQQGAVFVGTDPNEWWEGCEAFVEATRAQAEAMGGSGLQIVPGRYPMTRRYPSVIAASFFRRMVNGEPSICTLRSAFRNEEIFGEDLTA